MGQKITLSIPDMLHEKLQEWRDSFNFSKMFQDTLIEAIQKKEEFSQRIAQDMDLADIIKRLRQEKMAWEKQFYQMGRKEGEKWARSVRYEDLLYISSCFDTEPLLSHDTYKEYLENLCRSFSLENLPEDQRSYQKQQLLDGWFAGVKEFWDMVKEKI